MNSHTTTPDIGKIMKEARKSLGLTLERLSERTGVSRSMLSAIERGATNPTFSIVWALSQSLGVDLSLLESGPGKDAPIEHLHHYSTPMRRSADGKCELYMLSPRRTVLPVEWHRLLMKPGAELDSKPHAPGTFEHLTCLSGALSVMVGDRTVRAEAGDTLRYRSDCNHRISNEAEGETEAILLVAQPTQYQEPAASV
ncbi:helix-turn-helix domain-containing protein [Cribrihabitans pelagius]|uniref:helix-turn-helix domain-containing protein n=1 Tax=Cribrihabitans pelagius TaxID=1765746 RepID=UPI003B58EEB5